MEVGEASFGVLGTILSYCGCGAQYCRIVDVGVSEQPIGCIVGCGGVGVSEQPVGCIVGCGVVGTTYRLCGG